MCIIEHSGWGGTGRGVCAGTEVGATFAVPKAGIGADVSGNSGLLSECDCAGIDADSSHRSACFFPVACAAFAQRPSQNR